RIEFGRFAEENRKLRAEDKHETFDFLCFTHISAKNGIGRFTVRRKTIRKRMRAKLRQIKQELHTRMHDPVPRTGEWLKSVVQGYFNYHAVPGNLESLAAFRNRTLGLWWRTLRRRSQKHRLSWTRMLTLAQRWLPPPRALHPYPADRFAGSLRRQSSEIRTGCANERPSGSGRGVPGNWYPYRDPVTLTGMFVKGRKAQPAFPSRALFRGLLYFFRRNRLHFDRFGRDTGYDVERWYIFCRDS